MATKNLNTQMQVFNFAEGVSIRSAIDKDGCPWFIAADVCAALEIGNSRQAISRLDDDEKGVTTNDTLGGKQEMITINESGLYSLILTSRKAEAKKFKKWVTAEVLPTIRTTGSYGAVKQPRVDPEFLMIHKSVLDNTGKALVWMGDYGVTSQPYYGGAQPLMIDGRPQLQDSITLPMDDWIDVCDSVVALSKIFGEALSRSIQNNYAPLPMTVQVPTTLASKVSHSTSMIYTHTFRHVKSR